MSAQAGPSEASLLGELQDRFGFAVDERQIILMERYWALLSKWNRRLSLTTVRSYAELLEFHLFEGFFACRRLLLADERRLADIGSGAGFPGIAFSIFNPSLKLDLLESNHRKAVFLTQALRECGLSGSVFSSRAEEFADWDAVDAASVRALRTSAAVESLLREEDVPLLVMHGGELPVSGDVRFEIEERLPIPGSRNRHVSRLRFR